MVIVYSHRKKERQCGSYLTKKGTTHELVPFR